MAASVSLRGLSYATRNESDAGRPAETRTVAPACYSRVSVRVPLVTQSSSLRLRLRVLGLVATSVLAAALAALLLVEPPLCAPRIRSR